jgi:hypothetical protein
MACQASSKENVPLENPLRLDSSRLAKQSQLGRGPHTHFGVVVGLGRNKKTNEWREGKYRKFLPLPAHSTHFCSLHPFHYITERSFYCSNNIRRESHSCNQWERELARGENAEGRRAGASCSKFYLFFYITASIQMCFLTRELSRLRVGRRRWQCGKCIEIALKDSLGK